MNPIEIMIEISSIKVRNLMRHLQFADVMDFMGFRGFKCEGEYHYLAENYEYRKLHRFAINHFNQMIYDDKVSADIKIQPSSWKGHTRFEIDTGTRKRYVRQSFMDWKDWEREALESLHKLYKEAENTSCILAEYILEMIEDVSCELKYLERQIIEYEAVDWDMIYLMSKQDELHECYKEKTKHLEI